LSHHPVIIELIPCIERYGKRLSSREPRRYPGLALCTDVFALGVVLRGQSDGDVDLSEADLTGPAKVLVERLQLRLPFKLDGSRNNVNSCEEEGKSIGGEAKDERR